MLDLLFAAKMRGQLRQCSETCLAKPEQTSQSCEPNPTVLDQRDTKKSRQPQEKRTRYRRQGLYLHRKNLQVSVGWGLEELSGDTRYGGIGGFTNLIYFVVQVLSASALRDNTTATKFLLQSLTVGAAIAVDATRSDKNTSNSFLVLPESISPSPYGASSLSRK